ncbi:hypothetical protein HELRODRAFT_184144 [Helobdella robusta]|uniref:Uncharacterized protein n=1 Tax=Helobdella robusta TaxID=6412 RepID=T1FKN6_HELRO|nr:hypothetical protein HELRODRAFT_184144 [Helobdella robusta]ESO07076.1 hypothetical protein HELRODRAFT_184144 [Helobdella robusta]
MKNRHNNINNSIKDNNNINNNIINNIKDNNINNNIKDNNIKDNNNNNIINNITDNNNNNNNIINNIKDNNNKSNNINNINNNKPKIHNLASRKCWHSLTATAHAELQDSLYPFESLVHRKACLIKSDTLLQVTLAPPLKYKVREMK